MDDSGRLKILHVAQTAQGGVGSYLEEILALQVQRHGADSVRVVLPAEHAAHFPGLSPAWLLPFRTSGLGRVGSSLRMAVQALRAVRAWQPDIVHLHSTFAGSVMRPLLALMPHAPKVIYCAHGWAFDRKVSQVEVGVIAAVELLLSNLCDAVVCVSRHEASRARQIGIAANRLKVVLSGIADHRPERGARCEHVWPENRLRVLFVGRLDYAKGADVLFSAMEKLGDRAFAIVVGSAVVADYKRVLTPPGNVRCVGWMDRDELAPLYASADLLVVPSRHEAFGMVAVEAMRAGLPVVASRVGGLPELVPDGVVGRLVEAEDPNQLAEAIVSLDRSARVTMGARGRELFLQNFRIERVADELEAVYRTVVSVPQKGAPSRVVVPKPGPRPDVKILHVAQTAQGGVGSYLEEILALQVQRHGPDSVRVVLPAEHAAHFPGLAPAWLLPFQTQGLGRVGSSLRMAVQALRAVRDWKPDIVHLHSTFAGSVMRPLLALMPGAPKVVYCAHGWAFDRKVGRVQATLIAAVELVLSNLCEVVVCVSRHEASRAEQIGIPPRRLKIVLNGIADHPPMPRENCDHLWPKDRLRVLFVGRLDSQKGVDVLYSAMRALGERAFAIVVGSAVVSDVRSRLVPPANVHVVGWMDREQIAQLYASADLLVVPSRWEAFGLVALEAMRAGLPVVASRVGGLPEIVEDGVTGRLVDAEDAGQLAAAVASMDDPARAIMGARARERFVKSFLSHGLVEGLETVYRNAVSPIRQPAHPVFFQSDQGT